MPAHWLQRIQCRAQDERTSGHRSRRHTDCRRLSHAPLQQAMQQLQHLLLPGERHPTCQNHAEIRYLPPLHRLQHPLSSEQLRRFAEQCAKDLFRSEVV